MVTEGRVDTPKRRGSPEGLDGRLLPLPHLLPIPPHSCILPFSTVQVKSVLPRLLWPKSVCGPQLPHLPGEGSAKIRLTHDSFPAPHVPGMHGHTAPIGGCLAKEAASQRGGWGPLLTTLLPRAQHTTGV